MPGTEKVQLNAVGVALQDSFVVDLLPLINNILNQEYVLSKYAKLFHKTVEEIKLVLKTPPKIRLGEPEDFNAFVPKEIQLNLDGTYGWFWAGRDGGGMDWSNYLNINMNFFPQTVTSALDAFGKRHHQVYFITITLHELAHWLSFKLEATSQENPYSVEPANEAGENLELDLLGGRMASYYFVSNKNKFKIDGVVLLMSKRGQDPSQWNQDCRRLTEDYFQFFFNDMAKILGEVEKMRLNSSSGLPTGASLKNPLCGCEEQGDLSTSNYEIKIADRPMGDKRG